MNKPNRTFNVGWFYVFGAAVIEVLWVLGLKYAHDFYTWTATVLALVISFYMIIKACVVLPSGMVYAVFTGIGATAIALIDFIWLDADFTAGKGLCIGLIIFGVVGIQLTTDEKTKEGV